MDEEISDTRSRSTTPEVHSSDGERPIRGRGNRRRTARGRNRARGGRGRGRRGHNRALQGQPEPLNRAEVAAQARAERDRRMQERIDGLSEDQMKFAIMATYREQPSFLFRVLEAVNQEFTASETTPEPDPEPTPTPSVGIPTWCRCSNCREMPSEVEKRCCNQIPQNCHSTLHDFHNVVLDPLVLEVAMRYRNDMIAQPPDQDYNRSHRHTAYRQYVLWIHGYLGAGNRQVIPSCCVWAIRNRFPDPSGQYVGFIGGRFG
ncbi:uncharacterized protein LOC143055455 [Mytilus galloprovincialis]|uniref:uncharacterized protein LOC143055455 n=1 Tax=Mytilus galloprovincialis TaxID=29158 RepID=UPI003F7C271D